MAVAYCVLSHTAPAQVLRLARTLRASSADGSVVIHHAPQGPALDQAALDALGGVLRAPAQPVTWGRGSQLDALLRLLKHALTHTDADWFVLLSGQDHPARPVRDIEVDLAASDVDGYVDGDVVPPRFSRDGTDEWTRRYACRWYDVPEPGRAGRRLVQALRPALFLRDSRTGPLLGRRLRRTPFGLDLPLRVGQDWLTLRRPAAEALVHAPPALLAHYATTFAPTESLPHTLLHADPSLRLAGGSRRFVAFDPGAANPRVLRMADAEAILASGADFARKFDLTVDAAVLDRLDAAIA